jgi:hypothetical protein
MGDLKTLQTFRDGIAHDDSELQNGNRRGCEKLDSELEITVTENLAVTPCFDVMH